MGKTDVAGPHKEQQTFQEDKTHQLGPQMEASIEKFEGEECPWAATEKLRCWDKIGASGK